MKQMIDVPALREAYREGRNIMQTFNERYGRTHNTSEAIEIAYDLQAGQYVRNHASEPQFYDAYTGEQAALLDGHFPGCESLLDAGCGELTNTARMIPKLERAPAVFAFDLSWSRVHVGWDHYRSRVEPAVAARTRAFVAEMDGIPLPDNSVDVVMTSHALEPNRGREAALLAELLRVARRGLLLFEPSWELGCAAQRAKMDRHGYVRDLPGHLERLGASVALHRHTEINYNPLNRTAVTVVDKPAGAPAAAPALVDPRWKTELVWDEEDRVWHSPVRGVVYPTLRGIPVLRESAAMLATGFATTGA